MILLVNGGNGPVVHYKDDAAIVVANNFLAITFYKFACKYNIAMNVKDDDLIIGGWAGQSTISI